MPEFPETQPLGTVTGFKGLGELPYRLIDAGLLGLGKTVVAPIKRRFSFIAHRILPFETFQ